MSVSWNYNGAHTLDVQAVGTAGEWYEIRCDQEYVGASIVFVQADGAGAFGNTFTGIADPGGVDDDPGGANHVFGATIRHVSDSIGTTLIDYFACNVFQYGESTTTGHADTSIWTYDGSQTVSCALPMWNGYDYRLRYNEHAGGGGGSWVGGSSAVVTGTGLVGTVSVVMAFAPDPIQGFFHVTVLDPASPFGEEWDVTNRMFLEPSTTLIEGNPAISTTIKLVAVGDNPGGTSRIQTSPDGVYWTLQTDPDPTGTLFGVAWGNGTWVAVGDDGVVTSTDATTWTHHTNPITDAAGNLFGVAYSPALGLWVAVGAAAGIFVTTSPDGATWTAQTTPWDATGAFVRGVAWSDSLAQFVAVGEGDDAVPFHVVMTSPDGITWTNQSTPMDGGNSVDGVTWDSARALWVAVGANGAGTTIITSPDGTTWTSRFSGGVGASAVSNADLSLATSSATWAGGSSVATSSDDVTWTPQATPFSASGAQGLDWNQTLRWFAIAAVTNPGIFLTLDGVHYLGGFADPGGFTPQDVASLGSAVVTKRCRDCGSGLLGTLLRL